MTKLSRLIVCSLPFLGLLTLLCLLTPGADFDRRQLAAVCWQDEVKKVKEIKNGDLAGFYHTAGSTHLGDYEGQVTISPVIDEDGKATETYMVRWLVGSTTSTGVAFRSRPDELVVGWSGDTYKGRGVTVYKIQKGGVLEGVYHTMPGDGTAQTETLTLLKKPAQPKQAKKLDTE